MLIWFTSEYVLRVWSAGCRSRFQGITGRLSFMSTPFCIIGTAILPSLHDSLSFSLSLSRVLVDLLCCVNTGLQPLASHHITSNYRSTRLE